MIQLNPMRQLLIVYCLLMVCACEAQVVKQAEQTFGDTPAAKLAVAAVQGDSDTLQEIADQSPDALNARGEGELTPLHFALYQQSVSGIQALLEAGADASQGSEGGTTVMHLAAEANDSAYLAALLAAGENVNIRNRRTGETPLFSAVLGRRPDQLHMLLEAGAHPSVKIDNLDTPLHYAARINAFDLVLALLEAGAPVSAENARNNTFQDLIDSGSEVDRLNEDAKADRQAIIDWLRANGHPVTFD